MHILIVTDQHPDSLGGVQVAIRLQRRALERLGHHVTIAAPALHRRGYRAPTVHVGAADTARRDASTGAVVALPSLPITSDREYGLSFPGRRTDRVLARSLRTLQTTHGFPPVDVVHIQGDFWGALIGLRAARGLGVPVVHTMHNHVDEGTRAVAPFPGLAPSAFQALRLWRFLALGPVRRGRVRRGDSAGSTDSAGSADSAAAADNADTAGVGFGAPLRINITGARHPRGAWRYLAELAAEADAVTAPSRHFARLLADEGVADEVYVTPGGVDDEAVAPLLAPVIATDRAARRRPKLVWLGRMSHEKRVLEFVDAVAHANLDADVALHGAGLLLPKVRQRIAAHGLSDRVTIPGPVPYADALAAMRDADLLVQTSIGFETQGLTPFEAAVLGTPTVFSDPEIADDVAVSPSWTVSGSSVGALAETLQCAVADVRAAWNDGEPGRVRVSRDDAGEFLQSRRIDALTAVYAAVLGAPD